MAAGERCRSGKAGITGSFCQAKVHNKNKSYLFTITTPELYTAPYCSKEWIRCSWSTTDLEYA